MEALELFQFFWKQRLAKCLSHGLILPEANASLEFDKKQQFT
jgi:hypothetical protein